MSIVTDVFLPLALAFIMFALGLGLTGDDFLRVVKKTSQFFCRGFFTNYFTSNYCIYSCTDVADCT